MARPTRDARRRLISVGSLDSGDWIMLGASLLLFIALIANWWDGDASENAVWHSGIYFAVMLIMILATVILALYPSLQSEMSLRNLPVALPPLFILIGFVIFLGTLYELGRFTGVAQSDVSPGFGIYLALICSVIYLIGSLVKWGNRERRLRSTP
jgi:hypothetical protein